MLTQEDKLCGCEWDVLVILDACRADRLKARVPRVETIRALGTHTGPWAREMFARGLVPDGTVWIYGYEWPRAAWLAQGEAAPDIVMLRRPHPFCVGRTWAGLVNDEVATWISERGQPGHMIVHYDWPHWPYDFAPFAERHTGGRGSCPQDLVDKAGVEPDAVRAAYDQNIDYVLGYVLDLLSIVRGRVAITADHGELLGEHKRNGRALWGHYEDVEEDWPELWEIPWLEITAGLNKRAGVLPPHKRAVELNREGEPRIIRRHLKALGYL